MNEIQALSKIVDELEHRIAHLEANQVDKVLLKAFIIKLISDKIKPKRVKKEYTDDYELVWKAHPRGGKDYGQQAYKKIDHATWTDAMIIQSLKDHKCVEWKGRAKDKIPHLSTFLNGGHYKTEIKTKQKTRRATCQSCGRMQTDDRKIERLCVECEYKERCE